MWGGLRPKLPAQVRARMRGYGWARCGYSPDNVIPGKDLKTLCANQPFGATYIDDGNN